MLLLTYQNLEQLYNFIWKPNRIGIDYFFPKNNLSKDIWIPLEKVCAKPRFSMNENLDIL